MASRRTLLPHIALIFLLAAPALHAQTANGCSRATANDLTGQAQVAIAFGVTGLSYTPPCIRVDVGTQVTFNGSFLQHPLLGGSVLAGTPVADIAGPFVPVTASGNTHTFAMATAGDFPYYCVAHGFSGMAGAVYVGSFVDAVFADGIEANVRRARD
jgi:plastocyanin